VYNRENQNPESGMEITGNFNFQVGKVSIPVNEANDGQQIFIDGELKVVPEQARAAFGDAFHYVAFATMHDAIQPGGVDDEGDSTVTRFGYDAKKPPKWLTPALHHVDLWGVKQRTQPVIQLITSGDNEKAVVLKVRFIFNTNRDPALIGALACKGGQTAKVKIKPVQTAAIPVANAA
jgi:hypothetical protein